MAQQNKLADGEYRFTWHGKTTQLGPLTDAMFKAFDGYAGLKTSSFGTLYTIALTGHAKPDLWFSCQLNATERTIIVADQPTIEEDFV